MWGLYLKLFEKCTFFNFAFWAGQEVCDVPSEPQKPAKNFPLSQKRKKKLHFSITFTTWWLIVLMWWKNGGFSPFWGRGNFFFGLCGSKGTSHTPWPVQKAKLKNMYFSKSYKVLHHVRTISPYVVKISLYVVGQGLAPLHFEKRIRIWI